MKFKSLKSLPFLFLSIGLFIVGIALSSNALFNEQLEGEVFFDSINWDVDDFSYTSFVYEASFTEIKPGDAGMLSLGSYLDTDTNKIPTTVTFVYTVPVSLAPMEFYLVDNTGNINMLLHQLVIDGNEARVTLDTSIFTDLNDVIIKWFYPESATEHVVGTIYYGLEFEQSNVTRTLYTNVLVGEDIDDDDDFDDYEPYEIFTNVSVIVNTVNETVSFELHDCYGNLIIAFNDIPYEDNVTSYFLDKDDTGFIFDIIIYIP